MADLQEVFAEAVKLNRQIAQFLKFSTYTDYDDLSGLLLSFPDSLSGRFPSYWESIFFPSSPPLNYIFSSAFSYILSLALTDLSVSELFGYSRLAVEGAAMITAW